MSAKKMNTDSPFAALNAAQFPKERTDADKSQHKSSSKKLPPNKKSKALSASGPSDAPDNDVEAALFLQAVSSTHKLVPKEEPSHKKGQSKHKAPSGPDIPVQSALQALDDENLAEAFRQTFASLQPDAKPSPAPTPEPPLPVVQNPQQEALGLGSSDLESHDFFQAIKDVTPLSGKSRVVLPEPLPSPPPRISESNPLQDLVDGKIEFSLSGSDEFTEGHVVGLDLLTVGRLQARHYSPEAHIDLHGLNSEQAYQALVGFFRSGYHKGVRTVLIVTGRGLNSPNGTPILRTKIQEWFTKEPFRRVVLAFCTAKQEDGGTGALYVLLRKYRKNAGKIRWDNQPTDPDFFL